MRFRVQQLVGTETGPWEDRGWADGPMLPARRRGADAVRQVAKEAGSYRVRPADDDAAEHTVYRVQPDGSVERVGVI